MQKFQIIRILFFKKLFAYLNIKLNLSVYILYNYILYVFIKIKLEIKDNFGIEIKKKLSD